jgi:DNA polymerase I-like protein with 3'-5' exonuclease and polymerase domains
MEIKATTKEAYQLLHEGALAFQRAEQVGLRIDVEYCKNKKRELTEEIEKIEDGIKTSKFYHQWERSLTGEKKINIDSNWQLAHFLYDVKGIKPAKLTASGEKGSTDEESLAQLGISEIDLILRMRKLKKVRDTYLESFIREQVNGIIHPFMNLHLTRTYRPSMDSPNFQNIPIRDKEAMNICRQAVLPHKGHQLLEIDYSGIEVLIACCYTHDERLIYDATEGDMHQDMAIELYMLDSLNKSHKGEYNLRQGAKNGFVFPQFYGDYFINCSTNLLQWAAKGSLHDGTPALVHLNNKGLVKLGRSGKIKDADKFIEHVQDVENEFWNVRYKTYTRWKKKMWEDYLGNGYIEFLTGFRASGVMSRKQVMNAPIQGVAFHCLLWSFIELDKIQREQGWQSRLLWQIHDSIITDVEPKELDEVSKTIEDVTCKQLQKAWDWIIVPLKVEMDLCEVDQPWNTKKEWDGTIS